MSDGPSAHGADHVSRCIFLSSVCSLFFFLVPETRSLGCGHLAGSSYKVIISILATSIFDYFLCILENPVLFQLWVCSRYYQLTEESCAANHHGTVPKSGLQSTEFRGESGLLNLPIYFDYLRPSSCPYLSRFASRT